MVFPPILGRIASADRRSNGLDRSPVRTHVGAGRADRGNLRQRWKGGAVASGSGAKLRALGVRVLVGVLHRWGVGFLTGQQTLQEGPREVVAFAAPSNDDHHHGYSQQEKDDGVNYDGGVEVVF